MLRSLSLLLLTASLAACGGSDQASDRKGVANTVRAYLDAVADRDGARACRLLTVEAQLRIVQTRQVHAGPHLSPEGCARVIDTYTPIFGVKPLRSGKVSSIVVEGETARAQVGTFPVTLTKVAGEWKLAVSGVATSLGDRPPLQAD